MVIQRPVTQTVIATTAWGIPITDAVNALQTFQTNATASIAAYTATVPGTYNITGTLVDIPNFSITIPAGTAGMVFFMTQMNVNTSGTGTAIIATALASAQITLGATNAYGFINAVGQFSVTGIGVASLPAGGGVITGQIRNTGTMAATLTTGTNSRMTAIVFRGGLGDSTIH